MPYITKRYKRIVGWVIDSFWSDRIPKSVLNNSLYDQIFVTDKADELDFTRQGVENVGTLMWGADVLGNVEKVLNHSKGTDLLRVGRQPVAWENDSETAEIAESLGLTFAGRPKSNPSDITETSKFLNDAYLDAKFMLAFSTRVSAEDYTHRTKEYITGRWVDALAHGCVVAGVAPRSESAQELLWDGATIEISHTSPIEGLEVIKNSSYDEVLIRQNMKEALLRLDWRFRFKELFSAMGIESESLEHDLAKIQKLATEI